MDITAREKPSDMIFIFRDKPLRLRYVDGYSANAMGLQVILGVIA